MTRYAPETRARIITYPGSDAETATATSVPRRTVSAIRRAYRANPDAYGPTVRRFVEQAEGDSLDLVRRVRESTLREMLRRAEDPKTRAGELASIFREVRDEASLLEGRATVRTETTVIEETPEDYRAMALLDQLIDFLRAATSDEIIEWLGTANGQEWTTNIVQVFGRQQLDTGASDDE
jgi:hypothetical protein